MRVDIIDDSMSVYPWWENFFFNTIDYKVNTTERINQNLKPYRAKLIKNGINPYLEFDTEQDYVMFVLRWS